MTRPAIRRLAATALALVLFAGAPGSFGPAASAAPTLPPSIGNAVLFHLQLATDIDGYGNPQVLQAGTAATITGKKVNNWVWT